jgi:hypothetical protein
MMFSKKCNAFYVTLGLSALGAGCGNSGPSSSLGGTPVGGSGGVGAAGSSPTSGMQSGQSGTGVSNPPMGSSGMGASGAAGTSIPVMSSNGGVGGSAGLASAGSGGVGSGGHSATTGSGGMGSGGMGSGGMGSGGTGSGGNGSGGNGSSSSGGATFTAVYAIVMNNCSGFGCHINAGFLPAAGLDMSDAMTAYMNLVNAASRNCSGQQRVVPGMPDASVLVQALEHKGGCAPDMPRGKPMLSMSDIDTIVAWIKAGAMND